MCYAAGDEEIVDEVGGIKFNSPPSLKELQQQLAEQYGFDEESEPSDMLEYYKDGQWKKLPDPKTLRGNVMLRHPEMWSDNPDDAGGAYRYDEDEYDAEFDQYDSDEAYNEDVLDDDDYGAPTMFDEIIKRFVEQLRTGGCQHSAQHQQLKLKNGRIVDTKVWVLEQAKQDTQLQDALLETPGALSHIAEAIHYPFLWEDKKETQDKKNTNANNKKDNKKMKAEW